MPFQDPSRVTSNFDAPPNPPPQLEEFLTSRPKRPAAKDLQAYDGTPQESKVSLSPPPVEGPTTPRVTTQRTTKRENGKTPTKATTTAPTPTPPPEANNSDPPEADEITPGPEEAGLPKQSQNAQTQHRKLEERQTDADSPTRARDKTRTTPIRHCDPKIASSHSKVEKERRQANQEKSEVTEKRVLRHKVTTPHHRDPANDQGPTLVRMVGGRRHRARNRRHPKATNKNVKLLRSSAKNTEGRTATNCTEATTSMEELAGLGKRAKPSPRRRTGAKNALENGSEKQDAAKKPREAAARRMPPAELTGGAADAVASMQDLHMSDAEEGDAGQGGGAGQSNHQTSTAATPDSEAADPIEEAEDEEPTDGDENAWDEENPGSKANRELACKAMASIGTEANPEDFEVGFEGVGIVCHLVPQASTRNEGRTAGYPINILNAIGASKKQRLGLMLAAIYPHLPTTLPKTMFKKNQEIYVYGVGGTPLKLGCDTWQSYGSFLVAPQSHLEPNKENGGIDYQVTAYLKISTYYKPSKAAMRRFREELAQAVYAPAAKTLSLEEALLAEMLEETDADIQKTDFNLDLRPMGQGESPEERRNRPIGVLVQISSAAADDTSLVEIQDRVKNFTSSDFKLVTTAGEAKKPSTCIAAKKLEAFKQSNTAAVENRAFFIIGEGSISPDDITEDLYSELGDDAILYQPFGPCKNRDACLRGIPACRTINPHTRSHHLCNVPHEAGNWI